MHARQLMTHPIVSIASDLPTQEALVFAKMKGIHHLPVKRDDELVGLVCTCDLRELDLKAPVSNALHRKPVTVPPSDSARHIAELMRKECISSVLVKEGEDDWGIVTKDDLLEAHLDDQKAIDLIEACRCMYCQTRQHLRKRGSDFVCVQCLDRAEHPDDFEGGEVD